MKAVKSILAIAALGVACVGIAPSFAAGPAYTPIGTIKQIEAGWTVDSMAIYHSSLTITNPAGCPVTNAGYATIDTDSGHSLFHTLALAALLNGKQVKLLISGTDCAFSKPHVISVVILP